MLYINISKFYAQKLVFRKYSAFFTAMFLNPENFSSCMADLVGTTLGDCYLEEQVGKGAFSTVYRALNYETGLETACKVFTRASPQLEKEAEALLELSSHPNIVEVYEASPDYIEMELCKESLRSVLEEGPLEKDEAVYITLEVLSALEYAHGKGILHRDVKPSNILLTSRGKVKLCDFGLFKNIKSDLRSSWKTLTNPDVKVTREDIENSLPETDEETRKAIAGTFAYMAPEQAEGYSDIRSDIFSVGVSLYETLTGNVPIYSDNPYGDEALDSIILKSMDRNPDKRFQSASEMKAALESVVQENAELNEFVQSARLPAREDSSRRIFAYLLALPIASSIVYGVGNGIATNMPETLGSAGIGALAGALSSLGLHRLFRGKRSEREQKAAAIVGAVYGTLAGGSCRGLMPEDLLQQINEVLSTGGCGISGAVFVLTTLYLITRVSSYIYPSR